MEINYQNDYQFGECFVPIDEVEIQCDYEVRIRELSGVSADLFSPRIAGDGVKCCFSWIYRVG